MALPTICAQYPSQSKEEEPQLKGEGIHVPRLPLTDIGHFNTLTHHRGKPEPAAKGITKEASHGAAKNWNPAILVLSRASKSLIEADFRRLVPQGQHIEGWTGPGDIWKVIPARDPTTLQQINHYYLLFPNPAYARTYQNRVTKLHNLAQTHTLKSIESPILPPLTELVEGEDVQTLLQDYALCPSSQRIHITSMFAPFGPAVSRIVEYRGYPQITQPDDNTGRAVLFWVDGYLPTTHIVRFVIDQDGRDRGLPWATRGGGRFVEAVDSGNVPSEDTESLEEMNEEGRLRRSARWIIKLSDENEARRFVRSWHRRPFPIPGSDAARESPSLVNAEYLW
ncbi:MAG: hypothetical protein Q9220_000962 [cf. Caloplaca sp. 1 TL-2023]